MKLQFQMCVVVVVDVCWLVRWHFTCSVLFLSLFIFVFMEFDWWIASEWRLRKKWWENKQDLFRDLNTFQKGVICDLSTFTQSTFYRWFRGSVLIWKLIIFEWLCMWETGGRTNRISLQLYTINDFDSWFEIVRFKWLNQQIFFKDLDYWFKSDDWNLNCVVQHRALEYLGSCSLLYSSIINKKIYIASYDLDNTT